MFRVKYRTVAPRINLISIRNYEFVTYLLKIGKSYRKYDLAHGLQDKIRYLSIESKFTLMQAQTINEVISELDEVIEWANRENNPTGIFASLYRVMTDKVREGLQEGYFENPERLEKLDVIFANRYLNELRNCRNGQGKSEAWKEVYRCSQNWGHSILQYLISGINAHITFDLGIATAQVMKGESFLDIREDFIRINSVIQVLTEPLREDVVTLSPIVGIAYKRLNKGRTGYLDFSIRMARDYAWGLATDLSTQPPQQWDSRIKEADLAAHLIGKAVLKRGFPVGFLVWCIKSLETHNVEKITTKLLNNSPTLEECQICYTKIKGTWEE